MRMKIPVRIAMNHARPTVSAAAVTMKDPTAAVIALNIGHRIAIRGVTTGSTAVCRHVMTAMIQTRSTAILSANTTAPGKSESRVRMTANSKIVMRSVLITANYKV